jgi:hypothetical protein
MRRNGLNLIVALLTFALGVASTFAVKVPPASTISLLFMFAVPSVIVGTVMYQGAVLGAGWRPVIGKGFLAIFLWLFPSYLVAGLNLLYWVIRLDGETFGSAGPTAFEALMLHAVAILFSIAYGLAGVGLCLWVRRRSVGRHWLLRDGG